MLTRYRSNGANGRSVRFNSGLNRDERSHVRYNTDKIDRGFSLQKYSSGLDHYKPKGNGNYGRYDSDFDSMSFQKLRQKYGHDVIDHPVRNQYGTSDVDYMARHRPGYDVTDYVEPHDYGRKQNYLDLSYRKLPHSAPVYPRNGSIGHLEPRLARGILKKNESFLRRHLVLSSTVLDRMVDIGLIGDVMRRRILHMDASHQVPEIIRLLDDRGLGTLSKFLQVLRETGSGWIADVLLDTDAVEYEDLLRRDDDFHPREHYENRLVRYNQGALKRFDSADDLVIGKRNPNYGSYTTRAPSPDAIRRMPRVPLYDLVNRGHGYNDVRGRVRPGFFLSNSASGPLTERRYKGEEEIPHVLDNLEGHFKQQTKTNEVALSSLKQEEVAIRELMEQNKNEQQKIRKNQYTLMDINQKLKDVNVRSSEIYDPSENAAVSAYRLNQISQIPWQSSRY